MPPKVRHHRETVLDTAFNLMRKEGIVALSARKIAKEIGCSTQPVYSTFENMKMLEDAVFEKGCQFAMDHYLLTGKRFRDIGMGYIRMAQEEPELFKMLYSSKRVLIKDSCNSLPKDLLVECMKKDHRLNGLDDDQLLRILDRMWIYVHGICALILIDSDAMSREKISCFVQDMGTIVITWEKEHGGMGRELDSIDN